MQTHKKLKARILSLALSAAMVTTMMPTTVFATEGGNIAPGASSVGEIQSFDKLDSRFDPSTGKDAPSHVYGLAVELDTPEEDLNLPTELTAMVARTTIVSAPAEDEPVVDSGKVDEPAEDETIPDADTTIPDEDEVTGEDADDTVSDNQPATPSDATEDVTEEIKNEEVPLAPEPELEQEQDEETVTTTVEQETIPVTWNSDKEYVSDENGQFIYTAEISEDYILANGVKLPQIYVSVGRQSRSGASSTEVGTAEALRNAFTNAADGAIIKVTAAIDLESSGVTLNKANANASVKLDLNGKTITYSGTSSAITLTAGSLEITDTGNGGTVSATANNGYAIRNNGTGDVTVSDGTVSVTGRGGRAIYNTSTGDVTVSGGTVSNTADYAYAIYNKGAGTVTVSGGTVSAVTGIAISNLSTGSITISQAEGKPTLVTSANIEQGEGTIYLGAGTATATVLTITGGTVSNTATPEGYSVYNKASGIMDISSDATVGRIYPEPPITVGTDGKYKTLQAAFDAVTDGQTIKILGNIDLETTGVTLGKDKASVTLDLNGNTITYSGEGKAITLSAGSLTITDSASGGAISATENNGTAITNMSTGTVTVSGGTVSTTANGIAIENSKLGAVTVSGGTVSATADNGWAIYNEKTGTVTVSGGEVSATTGWTIYNSDLGAVKVSGGTVSATTGRAIYNSSTGLITISQDGGKTTTVTSANTDADNGTIYLKTGADTDTVLTITGGTVSNTASPNEGYSVYNNASGIMDISEDATVGRVYPEPTVAEIAGTKYATLQKAFTAVADGQTIKILNTIDLGESGVTLNKANASVKLDLNGKTITYSGRDIAIELIEGSLEITDTGTSGAVIATTGTAITNDGTGNVTISGGTVSALEKDGYGIIHRSPGAVNVSGGAVTVAKGTAIFNQGIGAVNVSGGTVSATTGRAIYNISTGLITISQAAGKTTLVTSANTDASQGTIYLNAGATTDTVLTITGGTVSNTATPNEGYSVYNKASGKMNISSAATVGRIYPEPATPTPGGGGSSSSQTIYNSLPPNHKGGTKIIGNVRVPDYTVEGTWNKNANGTWNLAGKDGQTYVNTWAPVYNPYANVIKGQSAFDWFKFDANGNMITGWHTDVDGNTYYLNPTSDNTLGAMKTGWVLIDGKYYYFNETSDGTRGKLFKSTKTPDGYLVDENGIWDGSDKQL